MPDRVDWCKRCWRAISAGEEAAYQQGFIHWLCLSPSEQQSLKEPRK